MFLVFLTFLFHIWKTIIRSLFHRCSQSNLILESINFLLIKKKSVTALLTAEKSMIGEKKKMNYKVELVLY